MKIPTWFRPTAKSFRPDFQDIVDESKAYLLEQTLTPMKDLGRTLIFGLSGSIIAALGYVLCLIGLLRTLQTETGTTFAGTWTFAPYLLVTAAGVLAGAGVITVGLHRYRKRANI